MPSTSTMNEPRHDRILVVIPSYRDSARLARFLPGLLEQLAGMEAPSGVLVVDDGSGEDFDAALSLIEGLRARFPALRPLLALPENQGKGGAIYSGWDSEKEAEWLAFVDADGAVPPDEVRRFCEMALAQPDVDVLIASRAKLYGRHIARKPHRHVVGRVYATLTTLLTGLPVYDSQCGCKLVRRIAYEKVRPRLEERRFSFDIELLCLLAAGGARIWEEPLNRWVDEPGSKVSLVRDSWRMFWSLMHLRRRLTPAVCRQLGERSMPLR